MEMYKHMWKIMLELVTREMQNHSATPLTAYPPEWPKRGLEELELS